MEYDPCDYSVTADHTDCHEQEIEEGEERACLYQDPYVY